MVSERAPYLKLFQQPLTYAKSLMHITIGPKPIIVIQLINGTGKLAGTYLGPNDKSYDGLL